MEKPLRIVVVGLGILAVGACVLGIAVAGPDTLLGKGRAEEELTVNEPTSAAPPPAVSTADGIETATFALG